MKLSANGVADDGDDEYGVDDGAVGHDDDTYKQQLFVKSMQFLIVYLSFYGHLLFCHGIPYWFKVAAYVPLTCQWFAYAAPSFHVSSMFNHVDLIELVLGSMVCRHSLSRLHTLAVLAHAHSIESS